LIRGLTPVQNPKKNKEKKTKHTKKTTKKKKKKKTKKRQGNRGPSWTWFKGISDTGTAIGRRTG